MATQFETPAMDFRRRQSQSANPYGPPSPNRAPAGRPQAGPWQGYEPGYLGRTGGAQPGSGWGYYYASSGRPTAAGGLGRIARGIKPRTAEQTSLSRTAMGYAENLLGRTPEQLADEAYRRRENIAVRGGRAGLEQELEEARADLASQGMLGSGFGGARLANIRRSSTQSTLDALDRARAESQQFGEQAAQGRLAGGVPWQGDEQGRRQFNAQMAWQADQQRRQMQAAAARAAAGGYERIIEIPGFGEVPESMVPYMMQYGGML